MLKKFKIIILMLAIFMVSCSSTETNNPADIQASTDITQSSSNVQRPQQTPRQTPQPVETNDSIQYTFVNLGALSSLENNIQSSLETDYHPVSFVVNGQQFRRNNYEKGWGVNGYYPEVDYEAYENTDAIYLYSKDYYDPQSTGYETLGNEVAAITNGDWNVFFGNVKYINYRVDTDRQPQQKWINFFSSELKSILGVDVPVVIYHAWLFEYNGMECAIVEADNIDNTKGYNGRENSTSLPASADNYAYRITGIFIGDRQPIVDTHYEFYIYKESINKKSYPDNIDCSFVAPKGTSLDDEDFGAYYFDTYQYNQDGNMERYSMYGRWFYGDNSANIIQCKPFFFVGDVDGDGTVEIVRENNYVSSLGHHIQVYDITDDGLERR